MTRKEKATISFKQPLEKPLSAIPPDADYFPPLPEFYKRAAREYLDDFVFKFVELSRKEKSVATELEQNDLLSAKSEMENAINELEMVLDQVPNLLWRERGYEHLLTLIRKSFAIGSNATVPETAQKFTKKRQAELARKKREPKTRDDDKKLKAAIRAVSKVQNIKLKKGDKFAGSIYEDVRNHMKIKNNETWPSATTIKRKVAEIVEEGKRKKH